MKSLALLPVALITLSLFATSQTRIGPHQLPPNDQPPSPTAIQTLPGSSTARFVVSEPGSYVLTGNVLGEPDKNGISIEASSVTIDLMGFVLRGVEGSWAGVSLGDDATGLVLRNGTIRDWQAGGVQSHGNGDQARFHRLRVIDNTGLGLSGDRGSLVEACVVAGNSTGVLLREGRLDTCVVSESSGFGVMMVGPGTARRCVVRNTNAGSGNAFRLMEGGPQVTECVVNRGNVYIESFQSGQTQRVSTVRRCVVAGSTSSDGGVRALSSSVLTDNLSTRHTAYTFRTGPSGGHFLEGNLSTDSGANAFSISGQSVAQRNASTGNQSGDNWDFGGGTVAGSFLPPGTITASNPFGHPLF